MIKSTRAFLLAGASALAILASAAEANAETFVFTGGAQTFTASASGEYAVELLGAGGGNTTVFDNTGGRGAEVSGDIFLTAGERLTLFVGGRGETAVAAGGGGGGSFVFDGTDVLAVAGGGGGAGSVDDAGPGLAGTSGGNGVAGGKGGMGGNGGGGVSIGGGGGGAGVKTGGGNGLEPGTVGGFGGKFPNGGAGGIDGGPGGFGGGGGGGLGGGGGGRVLRRWRRRWRLRRRRRRLLPFEAIHRSGPDHGWREPRRQWLDQRRAFEGRPGAVDLGDDACRLRRPWLAGAHARAQDFTSLTRLGDGRMAGR
jgi:hypothetical protein